MIRRRRFKFVGRDGHGFYMWLSVDDGPRYVITVHPSWFWAGRG